MANNTLQVKSFWFYHIYPFFLLVTIKTLTHSPYLHLFTCVLSYSLLTLTLHEYKWSTVHLTLNISKNRKAIEHNSFPPFSNSLSVNVVSLLDKHYLKLQITTSKGKINDQVLKKLLVDYDHLFITVDHINAWIVYITFW